MFILADKLCEHFFMTCLHGFAAEGVQYLSGIAGTHA
jgi:hypothetical protein